MMSCKFCGYSSKDRIELVGHLMVTHANDNLVKLRLTEDRSLVIQSDGQGFFPCHSPGCHFVGPAIMLHEHLTIHKDVLISLTLSDAFIEPPTTATAGTQRTRGEDLLAGADITSTAQENYLATDFARIHSPKNVAGRVISATPASNLQSQVSTNSASNDASIKPPMLSPVAHAPHDTPRFSLSSSPAFTTPTTPSVFNTPTPASSSRSYPTSIRVIAELPPVSERLSLAGTFIRHFSGVCVFHFLTNAPIIVDHQSFNDCDYGFGIDSHYQKWRKGIHFRASACYLCGCPYKSPQFEHDSKIGKLCPHRDWQEFVRPLAYTVFHARAIKDAVFTHLGIETDAFLCAGDYAKWLGYRSGGIDKMSNLMEVVYAVAALRDRGTFPESSEFEIPEEWIE